MTNRKGITAMLCVGIVFLCFVRPLLADTQDKWLIQTVKLNYAIDPNFNHPTETEIVYVNGHIARTNVINFKLIDKLVTQQNTFILFSGRECTECDAEKSLYVTEIDDAVYLAEGHTYPGQTFNHESQQQIGETRVFYGECFAQRPEKTVLFYTRYLDENQQWKKVLESIQFQGKKVVHTELQLQETTISRMDVLLNNGRCFEIFE